MNSNQLAQALINLRNRRGIVHHITNRVTIHDCANAALAIGVSPIMASHPEEVADVTTLSQALVLNIGTLEPETEGAMRAAGNAAAMHDVPIIFDPVGAGATTLRREVATSLPTFLPMSVIRCNAGEVMALYKANYVAAGVDAPNVALPITEAAKAVAKQYHTVVAVTGEVDTVTDGNMVFTLHNGVDLLPRLTGTGCMTTTLVGAFLTANDPLTSAIGGISYMSICGELAKERMTESDGLGTFSQYLHDAISNLTSKQLGGRADVRQEN